MGFRFGGGVIVIVVILLPVIFRSAAPVNGPQNCRGYERLRSVGFVVCIER